MGSSQNPNFSDFPNSFDIPNSDWNDVEGSPQSRRHTKSQNDFIREWLPWRAEYLNVILEGEQLAKGGMVEQCCEAEGSVWCMACTGVHAWCGPCTVKAQRNLPFHKAQRWNGTHYQPTSLMELGFFLHIGHRGDLCPQNWSDADPDEAGYMTREELPNHRCSGVQDLCNEFLSEAEKVQQCISREENGLDLGMIWDMILGMEDLPSSVLPAPNQVLICLQTGKSGMTDGHFTAQHMQMSKPELDVALSDGKGFMVAEVPYQSHPKQSLDSKERSTCSNHRAINAANINKSNLVLGMAALSPTLVDFQKGVRYMNADYSICNALGYHSESITKALVIYDVGCQWSVNFRSRVNNSPSLLPPALEIVPAVGKFHLAAHKLSCFLRESLNFIEGAGHLDGEILETLWAPFNKISPTARSMTQAHRQEAYEQLTAVLEPDKVAWWELDALRAEADREEALDIYLLKGDKAPTFHEVWLQLTKEPKFPSGNVGSVAWLAEGIGTEDSHNGQAFCKGLEIDDNFTPQDDPAFCGTDEAEHEDREFWDDDGDWEAPEEEVKGLASELMSIWIPSSIGAAKLTELGLHNLLKEERKLRIGQANDCLDQLRADLGNKAMLYQQNFRAANSTKEGARTKKEIQKVVARARQAILRLDPDVNMAERYQEILPEDLVVSKEVTEENRVGQGTSKLAWFWVMDGGKSQLNMEAGCLMEEFYRINWLKARARRDRWKEEVSLVRHEMLWTRLWFEYHKNMWEQRALQLTEPGKEAYARKQMVLWSDFENKASLMFQEWEQIYMATRMVFFPHLDPEDQDDEIAIMQHILAVTRKSWEDGCDGEDAREEKAHPTKAGDYKKAFTPSTATQRIFKDEMDAYDRERRDTKDPKTIGQRNRITQQW
ncbi:hypothetical protein EV401DRAFT_1896361 [Pisolithus croceorrhizus]|nr:hypothetical protein EV401DRAFT_1896361 [Pisolithus croceorrhizus]